MTTDVMTTGPWPEPVVVDTDAVALAVVRHEGMRIEGLPAAFDSSYGPVMVALQGAGLMPVGAALAVYEGDPMAEFAVEIGFPVDRPLPATAEVDGLSVTPSEIPAGRVAMLTHVGPYDELGAAWGRLMTWAATEGVTPGARYGEIYVTEPTPDGDPTQLRSDLFLTLA
ncbi:MAG: GyrI-like domain-containing protein [Tessaracoccus sp.]|uniref:GyrI-like domain-containing protein n=1 Tax=Tessaracoccus sp. TaxID=1971211 RepID=UPI001ED11D1B|nr:GyrI-like domain-containing protein [Tessaracoccus sp.]MBK7821671.1 GyrI-like domain-containing protein [Tessaracoccus sp.]